MNTELSAIAALWKRELIRFFRQTGRIAGAIGQPLLLWIFLSAGVGRTFSMKDTLPGTMNYREYFFPGAVVMVLLFTAIFSTISIIEDRQEGLLKTVLTAPVSRFSITIGKCSGGITIALIQGGIMLFLLATPWVSFSPNPGQILYLILIMVIISSGFTALGFAMAWFFDSTQAYHGMMSFFLIPMWMLSGALFPVKNLPIWLDVVMKANPLTYGLEAFRAGFYSGFQVPSGMQISSLSFDLILISLFALAMFLFAAVIVNRQR